MNVRLGMSLWVGIFALVMLPSIALADTAAPSAAPGSAAPVTPSDGEKLYEKATTALDRDDLSAALILYVQAAELNYMPAQVKLGEFADSSQYYETAVGWFLMAAMQGDAAGQYNLGRMYQSGNGIEKDDAKASYWMRRSAAKNYIPAVKALALGYRLGTLGLKVDLDQANAWDAKAARLDAIETRAVNKKLAEFAEAQKKLKEEAAKKNK